MLFLLLAVVFANTPIVTSSTPKGRKKGAGSSPDGSKKVAKKGRSKKQP
jgi:hypothetical protein